MNPKRTVKWIGIGLLTAAGVLAAAFADVWWTVLRSPTVPLGATWIPTTVVLAGDGIVGVRNGDAMQAHFSDLFGIAVARDGTVYVADAGDAQAIRAITPDGRVFTLAGGERGFADGPGSAARFDTPSGLAIDSTGTLYVTDTGNNAIRRISPTGEVTTIAGGGGSGYRDGAARDARFNGPIGVAVDGTGRVIVADTYNDRIRAIEPDGRVRTLAGSSPGLADGVAADARFHTPCGVAVDAAGNIHVADTGNDALRTISSNGLVTTETSIASEGGVRPIGIAVGPTGDRYVSDERGRIFEIPVAGVARTLSGSVSGFRDGFGADARFRSVTGIAVVLPGRLIVADAGNALVRLVAAPSRLDLRPPSPPGIAPGFDSESFDLLPLLWPIDPLEGPHEIAGTMGEARGSLGSERFHAGIDVRADEGTFVQAVRNGTMVSPIASDGFGSINEWLRIDGVSYVHLRAGRNRAGIPFDDNRFVPTYDDGGKVIGMRVKRGARFATGDMVGTVNSFNHVHMNVGWPGEECNPLALRLVQFLDTVPPTIARGGIRLYDEEGTPLTKRNRRRILLSGRVRIVVDAWDAANGNRRGRRLGLYDLGYQVLNRNGSPASRFERVLHTMQFDHLSPSADAARLVYAPGSGIPFYGSRRTRFLYIVTNMFRHGIASEGFLDTTLLHAGDYTLRIWAADIAGNVAVANRDVPITVMGAENK